MSSDSFHGSIPPDLGYIEYFVMSSLGLAVIVIRVISRIAAVGIQKLWWDDYVMILAG